MSRSKNTRKYKQRKRLRDVVGYWAPRAGIYQSLEDLGLEFPALISERKTRIEIEGVVKESTEVDYSRIVSTMRTLVRAVSAVVPRRTNGGKGGGKVLGWTYMPDQSEGKKEQDYRLALAGPHIVAANGIGKVYLELPAACDIVVK